MSALPSGELAVWKLRIPQPYTPHDDHLRLLSPEERESADRIVVAGERGRALASRVLLRLLLGSYLSCDPAAVRLETGRWGKPAVGRPLAGLCFNVAHSGELVLVALGRAAVGVDVERSRPRADVVGIAERFYSPEEERWVRDREPERRLAAFLRLWTRKEAVVKALGLALPAYSREAVVLGSERGVSWVVEGSWMRRVHWTDIELDGGYSAAIATVDEPPAPALYVLPDGLDMIA